MNKIIACPCACSNGVEGFSYTYYEDLTPEVRVLLLAGSGAK